MGLSQEPEICLSERVCQMWYRYLSRLKQIKPDSVWILIWAGCDVVMQASLLSLKDTGPTASMSWNLHLCEQDYHKLLEFFFSDSDLRI